MEDWRLLREYLDRGSDAAFAALVERHINLVYCAALRRLGDPHAAQDVTQSVFCLLAQKGRRLRPGTVLIGWLYQTACFKASNYQRHERRQRQREREAALMQSSDTTADREWEQIEPHLEEAMSQLAEPDRVAVLLRFFQRKPLKEVGETLGVSEDAARMRVERAIVKLRGALAGRGVKSTATALALIVAERSVGAAPSGLSGQVSQAAIGSVVSKAGLTVLILKLLQTLSFKLAAGATAIALGAAAFVWLQHGHGTHPEHADGIVETARTAAAVVKSEPSAPEAAAGAEVAAVVTTRNTLVLHLVAADTGEPVPNAPIEYYLREGTNSTRTQLQSTAFGDCAVSVPRDSFTELQLITQVDGFADTRLRWKSNQLVPAQYTLRLTRPVRIGGRVVDTDGQPVADAQVSFSLFDGDTDSNPPERHVGARTSTDADGRWNLNRVAPEIFRQSRAHANHTSFVDAALSVGENAEAEKQLLAATHVFQLGRTITLQGTVVDPDGQPVPGAIVNIASRELGLGRAKTVTTLEDGSFSIADCKPGKNEISADARGLALTNFEVQLTGDSGPIRITLERGFPLRLRLVNKRGEPAANARVMFLNSRAAGMSQVQFATTTDAEGRLTWKHAPSEKMTLDLRVSGYLLFEQVELLADGQEHEITLPSPLTISGTVRDAETRQPIQRFRIATGYPVRMDSYTNAHWSTLERFWLNFSDGKFEHSYTEPLVRGGSYREYVFKFMAEGYAPQVTRVVSMDEGEVRLDILLRPAADTIVKVLLPDGRTAAHADVGLVSAGVRLELIPGGLSRDNPQSGGALLSTDAEGRFRLSADEAITRLVVAHAEGYAEATPAELSADPELRLKPWGRVEGTLLSNGKPAADRGVAIQSWQGDLIAFSFNMVAYRTSTDQKGRFTFPKVPAGRQVLARLQEDERGNMGFVFHPSGPADPVDVRAGETTNVIIGASSHHVTLRVQWPRGGTRPTNWTVGASIHTPPPKFSSPPPDPRTDPHGFAVWRQNPQNRLEHGRAYNFTEAADGSWLAEDVQPGDYLIEVRAWENKTAPEKPVLGAKVETTLTIREDAPRGTIDLGELALKVAQ